MLKVLSDSVTYEKHFVAIRHESEIMTPLIESPLINFSLREISYLGAFGLSLVFAGIGSIPSFFLILTSPLFVLAFLRWHGEIPEMYVYFVVLSFFEPRKKKKKTKHPISNISGFGLVSPSGIEELVPESIQKVSFSDEMIPLDITLDIGESHSHEMVTILIDDRKVIRDCTNGVGQIVISIMPQKGARKFSILDSNNHVIICKTVEFCIE